MKGQYLPRTAASLAWVLITLGACEARGAPAPEHDFDIPAGGAIARLNQWADEAGIGLIGDFEKISGLATRAVRGRYTPEAALLEMTRGTSIACKYTQPRVMWCSLAAPAKKPRPSVEPTLRSQGTRARTRSSV